MCRLFVYFGENIYLNEIISNPPHNIIKQSYSPAYTPDIKKNLLNSDLNLDGFGCGWWIPEKKKFFTYKSLKPIWNDNILKSISNSIKSPLIIAHIRAVLRKKSSPVSDLNTHPFRINNWLWMHNGFFNNFKLYKSKLIENINSNIISKMYGSTDSEYCFGLFLSLVNKNTDPLQSMILLFKYFKKNNYKGYFNFITTDGNHILATRIVIGFDNDPLSLYLDKSKNIISSEPVYPKSKWIIIPKNSIVHIINKKINIIDLNKICLK